MLEKLVKTWQAKAACIFFLLYTGLWIFIQYTHRTTSPIFHFFGITYCLMALWGAIWGLIISKEWGGMKSVMGKAMIFFSLGLFAQTFGQITYSLYAIIYKIDVPYPSMGDIGYFGSIFLYIAGIFHLAWASGISLSFKRFKNRLSAVVLPLILLLLSYYIFLKDYQINTSNPLVIFLDFGYPLGQSIYLSLALLTYLLSINALGGRMKNRILWILFALLIQYAADFIFLFQASKGQWMVAGVNDYIYFFGYFVMTLGLLQLGTVLTELRGRPSR